MRAPLLIVPADRIAEEQARADEVVAMDAEWRRRIRVLYLRCAAGYFPGLVLAWSSLHFTGEYAQMALWAGLFIGNGVPLAMIYRFWVKENA